MKKTFVGLALVLALASGLLANGLNLNGFGARAAAMGGAFVGLADDYTAVFWNPAGLAQLKKPTFGLTGTFLVPTSKYALGPYAQKTENKVYPAGLLGYFQPIGDRLVVGLGAYTASGLGADWANTGIEAAFISPLPPAAFTPAITPYQWKSFIGSVTIAPTLAVRVTDQIFLGATFNANFAFFKTDQWGEYQVIPGAPPVLFNFGQATLDVKGWGFGATLGLLVKPVEQFSFGVTYRLQSKQKLSGTMMIENIPLLNPALSDTSNAKLDAISPMWLAGGVAFKPVKDLTVTFDLNWTNWKKLDTLIVAFSDPGWIAAPPNGLGLTENVLDLRWVDKLQIRGGIEYTFGQFAVRGGYLYDPAPAPDATMNILVPSFTYNDFTAGVGYNAGGFRVDVGFEYLKGKNRNIVPAKGVSMPGLYKMTILVPLVAVSYGW